MASTAPRPLGEAAPGGTTFSYAQAAKGRQTSMATSTVQPIQATPGTSTPPKERIPAVDDFSGNASGRGSVEVEKVSLVNGEVDSKSGSNGVIDTETKCLLLAPATSFPSSPSVGTASTSTLPKEDESSFTPKLTADSPWESPSQAEISGDQSFDPNDRKKAKKGKKDRVSEKEAEVEREEIKPEILVAAPPPAVNFWQQRLEAQAARVKSNPQVAEPPQTSTEDSSLNGTLSSSTSKSPEFRKKVRSAFEDTDRAGNPSQNAISKDQLGSSRPQRKGFESSSRPKEDMSGKRTASRGSRIGDKEDKSMPTRNLPPPVVDAMSWPTPDTALEEKRKTQEKAEKVDKDDKDEIASNKPRTKEKWVTVPYIPTVTFNTPMPTRGRGGRGGGSSRGGGGGGGGRGGHVSNGSISGERNFTSGTVATGTGNEPRERGRDNVSAGRAASLPPNSSNRSSDDNAQYARDQRKPSVSNFDKPKNDSSGPAVRSENFLPRESRRTSIAIYSEPFSTTAELRQSRTDTGKSSRQDSSNIAPPDNQFHPRSAGSERRIESNLRMNDFHKDANGQGQARERGEGRGERSRGAYRGRGNHANFQNGQPHAQHAFTNGHGSQSHNSYGLRQNSGPYSPPLHQQQQSSQYNNTYPTPSPASRANRAGPARSQSIPNSAPPIYSRFSPTSNVAASQSPPLQTAGAIYEYQGMQTMSATPFNPYLEPYPVLGMVTMQLEYYFSIDNLCKDVFLRRHMDSKGYVFLSTIANFKRIQSLTQDFELLRFACRGSDVIQIVVGEDGIDRLRRLDGWEKWVLPMEDRDEIARNEGPELVFEVPRQARSQPVANQITSAPHSAISPAMFSANAPDHTYPLYTSVLTSNDIVDPSHAYPTESPLSAAVPDFLPNLRSNLANELEAEMTFTDEEVDKLQLVYNHKAPAESRPTPPTHNASSRTFSNGSIDGRLATEELMELHKYQGRPTTNGDSPGPEVSPEKLRRSKSPFALSPTRLVFGNAPPVMWVKGQKDQAPVTEANKNEPYNVVRARALRHRELSVGGEMDGDMKLLYQFWSHFLVRNFNPRMYDEFRNCAMDDAKNHLNMFGVTNLIQYYDEVLNSKKKTIPAVLARHYVELVNSEDRSADRPGFSKLRTAWRNGALDMKSRKKVDNFVDPKLRDELER